MREPEYTARTGQQMAGQLAKNLRKELDRLGPCPGKHTPEDTSRDAGRSSMDECEVDEREVRRRLLQFRVELMESYQQGRPTPDSSAYLRLLEQVFGMSVIVQVLVEALFEPASMLVGWWA